MTSATGLEVFGISHEPSGGGGILDHRSQDAKDGEMFLDRLDVSFAKAVLDHRSAILSSHERRDAVAFGGA
jgi:hypothetical protein